MMRRIFASLFVVFTLSVGMASAEMRITEWMYQGGVGEFVEFTNVSKNPIDMTGWSYDDDSRLPGSFNLSGFGVVAPGESVIITEASAAAFRTSWGLGAEVKVLGGYTNNLGRNDEINLFNGTTLVDRLTYGDQNFPGSIRTQNRSGNPATLAALGANDPYQWVLAASGDVYGSYVAGGAIANPGVFSLYVVPEPSSIVLMAIGLGAAVLWRRKR